MTHFATAADESVKVRPSTSLKKPVKNHGTSNKSESQNIEPGKPHQHPIQLEVAKKGPHHAPPQHLPPGYQAALDTISSSILTMASPTAQTVTH